MVELADRWRMVADGPYLDSSDIKNFGFQYWGVRQRVKEGQSNAGAAPVAAPVAPVDFSSICLKFRVLELL